MQIDICSLKSNHFYLTIPKFKKVWNKTKYGRSNEFRGLVDSCIH